MRARTLEEFIEKARIVHSDTYDYSKAVYTNSTTKVCIICPEHGLFWQTPANHLIGKGCMGCSVSKANLLKNEKSKLTFFNNLRVDEYTYDNVEFVDTYTKVSITCHKHGDFMQLPSNHTAGHGCPKCAIEKNDISRRSINSKGVPTTLYYVYLPEYDVYKIGCTTKGLPSRFSRGKEEYTVIYTKEYQDSLEAYLVEEYILKATLPYKASGITLKSKGSSELRTCSIDIATLVEEAERVICTM